MTKRRKSDEKDRIRRSVLGESGSPNSAGQRRRGERDPEWSASVSPNSQRGRRPQRVSNTAQPSSVAPRLPFRQTLASLALLWERTWPRLWPAVAIAALFAALVLFDLLPGLAPWLHTVVLVGFGAGFAAALWWGFRGLSLPTRLEARRRLETASDLPHRPLTTVRDDMAIGTGDAAAEALWRAHQRRARESLKQVRVGPARPPVARRDPWALRGAVMLLLVMGVVVAWDDAPARFNRAMSPGFVSTPKVPVTVEAWVTPPDYTGEAPRMIDVKNLKGPLNVPRGTKLMIQIHGSAAKPVLTVGRQQIHFKALDKTSYQGTVTLYYPGRVRVEQDGDTVVNWQVAVLKDSAPTIAWAKTPEGANEGLSLRFDYKASDDYRVAHIRAYIARNGEVDVITLKLPVAGGRKVRGAAYRDLSHHRWAGLPVAIILEAEDDLGQVGASKIRRITLPQRSFSNPVARELVRQRMLLTLDPGKVRSVIRRLDQIARRTKLFKADRGAYLGLRSAQGRLILGIRDDGQNDADHRIRRDRAILEAQELMWHTAIKIEEGDLSEAERRLRRLQEQLARKLSEKNPDPKEIQKLLDQIREAMREYMRALRRDMQKNPQKYARPFNRDNQAMNNKDIQRLMEQLRDMLRRGDKEGAQRLLNQLRRMMEQLRAGRQGKPMDPNHPAMKMMRKFGDLIRRQQKLMDDTHKREQQRRQGNANPKEDKRLAEEQEKLRRELGELMRKLGEMTGKVPKNLGRAEQEMRGAGKALKGKRPGRATGPQARALDQLRKGARRAMGQIARRYGLRPGRGMRAGNRDNRMGRRRDPLGRRMDGMGPLDNNDIKVPTESQRKRARDILKELRRRRGESGRPKIELDYLERLLKQF